MEHDTLKSMLYEFYDGELPEKEARVFLGHLNSCQECQSEIELLRKTKRIFFEKPESPLLAKFSEMVMDRILHENESGRDAERATIFDWFSLPRWEVVTALFTSFFVLFYFSFDYLKSHKNMETNPIALVYTQTGSEQWLFSKEEIEKDDLLQIVFGNENIDESNEEAEF